MREAIILAGGFGTRLKPVTEVAKPIAPVRGRPFLAWLLDRLSVGGFDHVVLATGYLSESVRAAVGDSWKGMKIDYSVEPSPLGTGGAVALASLLVGGGGCHVMNGDTYLHYDPAALEACVREADVPVAMLLAEVADVSRYGAVRLNGSRVEAFSEKGACGSGLINAGCYFFSDAALEQLRALSVPFALEADFLVPLAVKGGLNAMAGAEHFIDIGIPEDYARAERVIP